MGFYFEAITWLLNERCDRLSCGFGLCCAFQVVVSNSVKDERQRRGFVLDMLAGPMTVWVGADVTNAVSSPDVRRLLL